MRETKDLVIESNRGQEACSLGRVVRTDSAGNMEAETELEDASQADMELELSRQREQHYSKARNTWHSK